MASGFRLKASVLLILVLCGALLTVPVLATTSHASSNGTLKLMVWGCRASAWISNAAVSVSIVRPGAGQVDSDSGYTNGSGYMEFTFDGLEDGDEAHLTVTPSGQGTDGDHIYYWLDPADRDEGYWDIGLVLDSLCTDDWYDQGAGIIKCAYELADPYE